MPRETKKKLSETQQSEGSEDNFAATMAQQVQSSWEKKKKGDEAKFLATAKAELDSCGKDKTSLFVTETAEMQAILNHFVPNYAAVDDKIRGLWQQLLLAQTKSLDAGKKLRAAVTEMDHTREKGQVRGMAISKKAVEDCNRLITSLTESE